MERGSVKYQGPPDTLEEQSPDLWKNWQKAITLAK